MRNLQDMVSETCKRANQGRMWEDVARKVGGIQGVACNTLCSGCAMGVLLKEVL